MRKVSIDQRYIAFDLGQLYSPSPVEAVRPYVAILLKFGLSPKEIEVMLRRNPARLPGLK
jgi:hypothetical protein